jgi:putative glycerol-1-phosphate prenyltransferase
VLIDPDKQPAAGLPPFISACEDVGVDALFLGGSLMHAGEFDAYVRELKSSTVLPVIGFPGSVNQVSRWLDAILFLSLVSGRNPEYLIGQHVYAAPKLHALGLETIATGYMLVESGALTAAQYMSATTPLPRSKPDIAVATALAAEMMGMKMLYLDAGSGARQSVPVEMISAVAETCRSPVMVGGGLKTPRDVSDRVRAGARIIIVGNAIEDRPDRNYIAELALAARSEIPRSLSE